MNPTNFDYKFYLGNYLDLRNLNETEAYNHFINHGIKEGRICHREIINTETNITIVIHLYHTHQFEKMSFYIEQVKRVFLNVTIIFTINEHSDFDAHITNKYPASIIIKVENKGVDVYPFLLSVRHLRTHNIDTDFILKLHTKESSNPTEGCVDWKDDLITPIVDYNNLTVLQHYFKKMENIGYVASQKCVLPKNYDLDFPSNIKGLYQLIDKFPHLEKDWTDFNGGNMFWIGNNVLTKYLTEQLIDYLIDNFLVGKKPPCNLTDPGIYVEYLCERLFTGVFCYDSKNILVNAYNGTQRGISSTNGQIDHTYFYQPKVFSISIPKNIIT
jgi:hypothetical protein